MRVALPRRTPGCTRFHCIRPPACQRTEKRIFFQLGAYAGTDRIRPDVPSDRVRRIILPQEVIVEFFLPQRMPHFLLERRGRFGFESLYKFKQVAGCVDPLEEKMEMVGHEAVGMNGEGMDRGIPTESA